MPWVWPACQARLQAPSPPSSALGAGAAVPPRTQDLHVLGPAPCTNLEEVPIWAEHGDRTVVARHDRAAITWNPLACRHVQCIKGGTMLRVQGARRLLADPAPSEQWAAVRGKGAPAHAALRPCPARLNATSPPPFNPQACHSNIAPLNSTLRQSPWPTAQPGLPSEQAITRDPRHANWPSDPRLKCVAEFRSTTRECALLPCLGWESKIAEFCWAINFCGSRPVERRLPTTKRAPGVCVCVHSASPTMPPARIPIKALNACNFPARVAVMA